MSSNPLVAKQKKGKSYEVLKEHTRASLSKTNLTLVVCKHTDNCISRFLEKKEGKRKERNKKCIPTLVKKGKEMAKCHFYES